MTRVSMSHLISLPRPFKAHGPTQTYSLNHTGIIWFCKEEVIVIEISNHDRYWRMDTLYFVYSKSPVRVDRFYMNLCFCLSTWQMLRIYEDHVNKSSQKSCSWSENQLYKMFKGFEINKEVCSFIEDNVFIWECQKLRLCIYYNEILMVMLVPPLTPSVLQYCSQY